MAKSNENTNPGLTEPPSYTQGGWGRKSTKFPQQVTQVSRRALSSINQNVIGARLKPCVVIKRDLPENKEKNEKNQLASGDRSIKRKLAEQCMRPRHEPQENKKIDLGSKLAVVETKEHENASDVPVLLSLKRTTEVVDEDIEMLMDVEMEDVEEDFDLDIDSKDVKNPLAVTDYVEDIYAYYRKTEIFGCVSPNYMVHQVDLNEKMRAILIDWLIEVHFKFELMEETLFLTVNLIDRFLERQMVPRKKLQLVGVTATLLACKYEEVFVPPLEDLILITDRAYTRVELLDMEKLMLNLLQFNLSIPTTYVFLRRFLKSAHSDQRLEQLSSFIIELCLVEYVMLKFPPSLLAASAIYTAECSLHRCKKWTKTSEWHSNYSEDQLMECSRLMVNFHQKAAAGDKLNAVWKKYSTCKFGYAANTEPALFLLYN